MCWASHFGFDSVAELLLNKGEDIEARGDDTSRFCEGQTALQLAAFNGHESTTRILLLRGADIDMLSGGHGSALQAAVAKDYTRIFRLLLDLNANRNLYGFHGTALQLAAWRGD